MTPASSADLTQADPVGSAQPETQATAPATLESEAAKPVSTPSAPPTQSEPPASSPAQPTDAPDFGFLSSQNKRPDETFPEIATTGRADDSPAASPPAAAEAATDVPVSPVESEPVSPTTTPVEPQPTLPQPSTVVANAATSAAERQADSSDFSFLDPRVQRGGDAAPKPGIVASPAISIEQSDSSLKDSPTAAIPVAESASTGVEPSPPFAVAAQVEQFDPAGASNQGGVSVVPGNAPAGPQTVAAPVNVTPAVTPAPTPTAAVEASPIGAVVAAPAVASASPVAAPVTAVSTASAAAQAATPPSAPAANESAAASETTTKSSAGRAVPVQGVSKSAFVIVCSYASALTIWLLFSLFTSSSKPHPLEYLPDLTPQIENGKVVLKLAPEEADVAPGHTLRLGEAQQFGHLLVKPVKVTRGNVDFVHYDDRQRTRPSEGPVLKLWLELQNVSGDLQFPPLGKELLLRRTEDAQHPGRFRANTFVCQADQKRRDGLRLLTYDLPQTSDWDLKFQDIDHSLGPNETLTTYIASQPGVDSLTGEMVWRVHLRIGYHPKTQHGVTTLVEVTFHSDDIRAES